MGLWLSIMLSVRWAVEIRELWWSQNPPRLLEAGRTPWCTELGLHSRHSPDVPIQCMACKKVCWKYRTVCPPLVQESAKLMPKSRDLVLICSNPYKLSRWCCTWIFKCASTIYLPSPLLSRLDLDALLSRSFRAWRFCFRGGFSTWFLFSRPTSACARRASGKSLAAHRLLQCAEKIPTPREGEGGGGQNQPVEFHFSLLGNPGIVIQPLKWNFKVTFLNKPWALVRKYLRLAPEELSASMMTAAQFFGGMPPLHMCCFSLS